MAKILVTGSSGLVGKRLCSFLTDQGYEVLRLVRKRSNDPSCVFLDPKIEDNTSLERLEGLEAIIHLAGESLAEGMWTKAKKKRILESRQKGTEQLVQWVQKLRSPPKLFVGASAIGYYESSLSPVTEMSLPGSGFLSKVCLAWEGACKPLESLGIRVVQARFGIILSDAGGMLKALHPLFLLGLGAKLGNGKQIISWVALDDAISAIAHILKNKSLQGPVNIVSPLPVSQEFFAKTFAEVLSKPCFLSIPRCLIRGEKAKELFFSSIEALPFQLKQSGFSFAFPSLKEALKNLLLQKRVL